MSRFQHAERPRIEAGFSLTHSIYSDADPAEVVVELDLYDLTRSCELVVYDGQHFRESHIQCLRDLVPAPHGSRASALLQVDDRSTAQVSTFREAVVAKPTLLAELLQGCAEA